MTAGSQDCARLLGRVRLSVFARSAIRGIVRCVPIRQPSRGPIFQRPRDVVSVRGHGHKGK